MRSHQWLLSVLLLALVLTVPSCKDKGTSPSDPDFSTFKWIDFDLFRTSYNFGSYNFSIQTQLIRRIGWKQGQISLVVDSTLNEYVELCSPILGDTMCYSYFKYFLVDSIWLSGSPGTKLYHQLPLERVVLSDTTIPYARSTGTDSLRTIDPSIPRLDQLLSRTFYASVTVTKRKIPSHDGINYSVDYNIDINRLWIK